MRSAECGMREKKNRRLRGLAQIFSEKSFTTKNAKTTKKKKISG
jgi:hypothetical protein